MKSENKNGSPTAATKNTYGTSGAIEAPNFTQIPNIIFDYWMSKIKPTSFVVLVCLCRKIFGWHKTSDAISLNQLVKVTNLSKPTLTKALKELEDFGLVIKVQSISEFGNNMPNEFQLNISIPQDDLYTDKTLEKIKADNSWGEIKKIGGGSQNSLPGVVKNLYPQNKDITKERKRGREEPPPLNFDKVKKNNGNLQSDNLSHVVTSHGPYVCLKAGEYEELCKKFGKDYVEYYIEAINNHVPNAKPYKDYAATIRNWHLRDKAKGTLPSHQNLKSLSEPINERIVKNRHIADVAEAILKDRFNSYVYFSAGSEKASLYDHNKHFSKEYIYEKFDSNEFKQILLNDLENIFHGAKDILLGKKSNKISNLIDDLSEKSKIAEAK